METETKEPTHQPAKASTSSSAESTVVKDASAAVAAPAPASASVSVAAPAPATPTPVVPKQDAVAPIHASETQSTTVAPPAAAATDTATAVAAPPLPTDAAKKPDRHNHGQFELKVKKDYIVTDRPASLGDLPEPTKREETETPHDSRDDRDRNDNNKKRGKKKRKGQNKKRPRDVRPPDSERLCLLIVQGEDCPHKETCKFSHDIETYRRTKPNDLEGIDGGCPGYRLQGFCKYGVCCRFASTHTTKDGKNLRNPHVTDPAPPVQNVLDRAILIQLRKKQYPFICKRHFEDKTKTNKDSNHATGATAETPPPSAKNLFSAPVPTKERKLIDFSNKVYVAPLTTVGNLPFRRIMKHFQADITCGEMAVATCLLEGKHSEWSLVKRHHSEDVFGVQIAAGHPDQFMRCCEVLEKHVTVDFVDLNLGCPLDIICNKGAGSQMMLREKRFKESLIGICNTLSVPVTVKMRTGWDESRPIAHNLVSKMQTWGIDGVATVFVHGRSRLQRYSKSANWDFISQVAMNQSNDLPKIPIVGNGDIFSYTDYEEKVAREGINATAMLARGALIKPWLPTEIKERRHWDISATERLDILKDFCKFGLEHWGSDQQGVNTTRRFLLEWLSFLHRYVPVGLLEHVPQQLNHRPPNHMVGRNDLETLFMSTCAYDWVKISEMLLGPVPEGFDFEPKHKASSYRK